MGPQQTNVCYNSQCSIIRYYYRLEYFNAPIITHASSQCLVVAVTQGVMHF